jgi:hypothetical protein
MKMVARSSWLWRRTVALGLVLSAMLVAAKAKPMPLGANTPLGPRPGGPDPDAPDDARAWQDTVPGEE